MEGGEVMEIDLTGNSSSAPLVEPNSIINLIPSVSPASSKVVLGGSIMHPGFITATGLLPQDNPTDQP
jgi:hypothetical protein